MVTIVKNFFHYIKCLFTGEEYISQELKLIYTLHTLSAIHVILTILFICLETTPLILQNILSVAFYQWMVSLCKKKMFMAVFTATSFEIILFTVVATLSLGNSVGFSLYCISLVPALFYTSYMIKKSHSKSWLPIGLSLIAMLVYVYCSLAERFGLRIEYTLPGRWDLILYVSNIVISFSMTCVFCLLFIWEMKNSQAILEKRNNQLTMFANRDPLTKLPNRRCMMERLNVAMHNLALSKNPFCLILGDIDNFKKVNDTYGHDAGDRVLVTIANLLSSQMRDSDYVCRWGGEEILIMITDTPENTAIIAERIRLSIQNTVVEHGALRLHITMTFGIAPAIPGYRIEQIIKHADTKLYYGKEHGKNQIVT